MTDTTTKRAGRPRNFDRGLALQKAMHAFWALGYEGASMTDLVGAMGINSPSIYAAFGSKRDLFLEAIQLYVDTDGGTTFRALKLGVGLRDTLEQILLGTIDALSRHGEPRACLLILGAHPMSTEDPSVFRYLRDQRLAIRKRIQEKVVQAQKDGELAREMDSLAFSTAFMTYLSGISVAALDGTPRDAMRCAAHQFLGSLFPAAPTIAAE